MKEEFDKEVFEITSWQLTNERVNRILQEVNLNKYKAWNSFNLQDIQKYFASVLTFFDEVFVALKSEQIERIQTHIRNYWNKYLEIQLKSKDKVTFNDLVYLLVETDKIQQLIRFYLQSYDYFFRKREKDVKSIEKALEVVMRGGGIFGVA